MADLKQIAEWRKHCQQSIWALRVELAVLLVLAVLWLLLSFILTVPSWLVLIVGGVQAFSIVLDGVNVLSLKHKLHKEGW